MSNLKTLVAAIIADGIVDAEEVTQLRTEIMADGVIDLNEVNALFEINDATSGNKNHESWQPLFVEAISSNILADGTIDKEETQLLVSKIQGDGQVDTNELALLNHLKTQIGAAFPNELNALIA